MADTTNKIAEGEVLQLMNCNDPELKEDQYQISGVLILYNNMLQSLFDSQIKTFTLHQIILVIQHIRLGLATYS